MKTGVARRLEIERTVVEGSKLCGCCQKAKPRDQFYRNRAVPDGLTWDCKVCHKRAVARWKHDHPEKERARQRAFDGKRNQTPPRQTWLQEYGRRPRSQILAARRNAKHRLKRAKAGTRSLQDLIRLCNAELARMQEAARR